MRRYLIPPLTRAAAAVAAPVAISRAAVFLAGLIASLPDPSTLTADIVFGTARHLARWDSRWYLDIAAHGYRWNGDPSIQQNVVFFPLYPALVRGVGAALGGHLALAGWIVSLAAFFAACIQLWRLVHAEFGHRVEPGAAATLATTAIVLLCAYPFALYFTTMYSESLFLWLVVSAFLAGRRGAFLSAATWGLLAGLARPNGAILALPIAWMAFRDRNSSASDPGASMVARAAAVVAPVVGTALYSLYLQTTVGDGLAWYRGQAAWTWIDPNAAHDLVGAITRINPTDLGIGIANGCAAAFALAALVPAGRLLGMPYALFIAASVLPPLARHGLLSAGRFTSVVFPLFVWAAWALRNRPRLTWMVIAGAALAQIVTAVLFFTGRPIV